MRGGRVPHCTAAIRVRVRDHVVRSGGGLVLPVPREATGLSASVPPRRGCPARHVCGRWAEERNARGLPGAVAAANCPLAVAAQAGGVAAVNPNGFLGLWVPNHRFRTGEPPDGHRLVSL